MLHCGSAGCGSTGCGSAGCGSAGCGSAGCGSAGCGSAGINSSCAVFSRKYGISSYVHFCGEEEVKYIVLMYFGGEFVSAFCGEDRVKYNVFFFEKRGKIEACYIHFVEENG